LYKSSGLLILSGQTLPKNNIFVFARNKGMNLPGDIIKNREIIENVFR